MSRERLPLLALVGWGLVVAVFLLSPVATLASGSVAWVGDLARSAGAPSAFTAPGRVEFAMNAVAFAPLTFFAHWVFPGRSWQDWTAYGFVASMGVEAVQALYLSARSAEFVDVVANTSGALLGALAASVVAAYRDRDPNAPLG